jgi:signal transduction histidine kinase/CheY-like chemotaxis protein
MLIEFFRRSLVYRLWLIFGALYLFSVILLGYFVFQSQESSTREAFLSESGNRLDLAVSEFRSRLESSKRDISLLAGSPSVLNYLEEGSPQNLNNLKTLFAEYLKTRPDYFQIRLISSADGRELVRIDKSSGGIVLIPGEELQLKKNREYYQESLQLREGEYYFSDINLNRERGAISQPETPTIRASALLRDDRNQSALVLVINVDVGQWLDEIAGLSGQSDAMLVFKENEEYVLHPDRKRTFSEDKQTGFNFGKEFRCDPPNWGRTDCFWEGTEILFRSDTLSYYEGRTLNFYNLIPTEVLLARLKEERQYVIWLGLLFLVIGLNVLFFLARRIAKPIAGIQEHIQDWEAGSDTRLEEAERRDEIGKLARSFQELGGRLNDQIDEIEEARQSAVKSSEDREHFVANLSHELKTPLNSILGMTAVLEHNDPLPKQKGMIETLKFSTQQLRSLIGDVLDISKIEQGKILIKRERVVLEELVRNVCLAHKAEADNKGVELNYNLSEECPDSIVSDGLRLYQILNNLVSNAVKFTQVGSVQVEVAWQAPNRLKMRVVDSGPGIAKLHQEEIFDRFNQAELGRRTGSGLGLGLSIVSNLCRIMQGEISVNSEEGKGSAFSIEIPVKSVENSSDGSSFTWAGEALNILYIDDVEINRYTFERIFEDVDWKVVSVESCGQALEALNDSEFDVLFLDLKMPEVDGFKCAPMIQERTQSPIIALSANLGDMERSNLLGMGVTYMLEKPIDRGELIRTLGIALDKRGDIVRALSAYVGNDSTEDAEKLLALFVQELRHSLTVLNEKGTDGFDEVLHRLKPSLTSLGREDLLKADFVKFQKGLEELLAQISGAQS